MGATGATGSSGSGDIFAFVGDAIIIDTPPPPGNIATTSGWFFTGTTVPPIGPFPQAVTKTQLLSGNYSVEQSLPIVSGDNTATIYFPNDGPPPTTEGETATYVAQLGPTLSTKSGGEMRIVYLLNATATVFSSYIAVTGTGFDVRGVIIRRGLPPSPGTSSINFIVVYN
jgi:hypothetical protein